MASKLPYLASPGLVPKILSKMKEARRPERFTQDFLGTKLGFTSGSARAIIPLLKRLGFLSSDGTPTPLYDQFRNPASSGAAMAAAVKQAFHELYERNEFAHDLSKDKLIGMITEVTGASPSDSTTKFTAQTFENLKEFADFEGSLATASEEVESEYSDPTPRFPPPDNGPQRKSEDVNFAVSYTINLNLPETTNPEVFNAIFRALKENLLSR